MQHPLRDLYFLAVPVTINTDDPSVSDTTLTDEYQISIMGMGFTIRDIQQMILNAAHATFLPPGEKQDLIQKFQGYFGL
jgi:adenosine deaminase